MMDLLADYRQLLAISREMVALANREDAAGLLSSQETRAGIIARLPASLPALSGPAAGELRQIIEEIQRCDAEILEYATLHRDQLGTLLKRFSRAA